MSKLTPIDLSFLLLETPSRQMHMAAYQLFKLPAREKNTFIPKLLRAFRNSEVAKPFNQKLKWLDKGVASWEPADVDPNFHIRHLAVPAPGRMEDFFQIISFLNMPLLDRARPLWECYVIEGIEDDQFAVFIKVHHAMIDGMGAMKLFDLSLSRSATDKSINSMWMPFDKEPRSKRPGGGKPQVQQLLARLGKLPTDLLQMGASLADLGAQNLRLKPSAASLPFGAQKTLFNHTASSSERRYANCEMSLARVKALAKATGTTVNDVVMTLIDNSLHGYLKEHKATTNKPLVAVMAMTVRSEGDTASVGNQASIELVSMGEPKAALGQRLQQMHASTSGVKSRSSKLPKSVRSLYSLLIFGSATLPDMAAAFKAIPSGNLVISNMVGPKDQRYLAGARLTAFHGCPIIPPGAGLNVTFVSVHDTICLSVGSVPEAMDNPYRLTRLILESLDELERISMPKKAAKRAPRKKK